MQYRIVSFRTGFAWLKQGGHTIGQYPLGWFGLAAIYFLLLYSPVAGVILGILEPALLAGIFRAGQAQRRREAWTLKTILSPLTDSTVPILVLGGVLAMAKTLAFGLILLHISSVLDLEQLYQAYLKQDIATIRQLLEPPGVITTLLVSLTIGFFLALVLSLAGIFSPVLVSEYRISVPEAIVLSLKASIRNIGALTAYTSIVMIALLFANAGFVIILLPVIAWLIAAYSHCVNDIFPAKQETTVQPMTNTIEI